MPRSSNRATLILPKAIPVGAGPLLFSRPQTWPGLTPGSFTTLEFAEKLIFSSSGEGFLASAGR